MMNAFETFYNILFHPVYLFRTVSEQTFPKQDQDLALIYAVFIVMIVSAFGVLYTPLVGSPMTLWLNMGVSALLGVLLWLMAVLLFALPAYVFGGKGKVTFFIILSGFSLLPWIFLPVFSLFQATQGMMGNTLYMLSYIALWFWSTVLFFMAVKYAFHLSMEKVLLVVIMPLVLTTFAIIWTVGGIIYSLLHLTV